MKIVIIGAAPCGLGAAYRIDQLLKDKVIDNQDVDIKILEQESFPGGLSCTVVDEKGFLWDMGGHITFHHNFPYYQNAVKSVIEDWNHLRRNCQTQHKQQKNKGRKAYISDINIHITYLKHIERALNCLKNGKAEGPGGIQPELLKYGGNAIVSSLEKILENIWENEVVPKDWSKATCV